MREIDASWIPAHVELGHTKLGTLRLNFGSAITLWPLGVFYRYKTPSIKAHEEVHWAEQRRCGGLPWFVAYLLLLPFFGGGRKHPMEKWAYHVETITQNLRRHAGD